MFSVIILTLLLIGKHLTLFPKRPCITNLKVKLERIETRQIAGALSPLGHVLVLCRVDLGALVLGGSLWRASLARFDL